jgi:hypothetical protein
MNEELVISLVQGASRARLCVKYLAFLMELAAWETSMVRAAARHGGGGTKPELPSGDCSFQSRRATWTKLQQPGGVGRDGTPHAAPLSRRCSFHAGPGGIDAIALANSRS